MLFLESLYKLRIRESAQLKNRIVICTTEDIDAQLSNIEDNGAKEYRSENYDYETLDARHGRIETGAVGPESKGD